MRRLLLAASLVALWAVVLVAGAWLLQYTMLGILPIIVGVLGFVLTFASSFPQSTLMARED